MENEPQSRTARREAERMASGHKKKVRGPRGPKRPRNGRKFKLVRNIILSVIAVLVLAVGVVAGTAS